MKPTENQIKLANAIADEIRYFGMTNDLKSPSHHTLIDEAVDDMVVYSILKESDKQALIDSIQAIRYIILSSK